MKVLFALFAAGLLLTGCAGKPPEKPLAQYHMRGEILKLDPTAHVATIKGDKIEGWMEAMTMEYPVKNPQEFDKLKIGEIVQANVLVQGTDYWLSGITDAPATPAIPESPAK